MLFLKIFQEVFTSIIQHDVLKGKHFRKEKIIDFKVQKIYPQV